MPSLTQLRAEPWWDREIVTAELDWLGDELCRRTGRPRAAAGTKGDENHLRGAHRSQEWLRNSRYCTNRSYTVQSGLTTTQARQIGGFDFTPGSAEQMIAQCRRLYAAVRSGRLEEVREFYGNVDGDKVVDGWDNVENEPASSDSSHLWHWHLTIDRRRLTDRALMQRILAIALGEEEDMTPEQDKKLNDSHFVLTQAVPNPAGDGRVPLHVWAGWMTGTVKALAGALATGNIALKTKLDEIDQEATDRAVAEEQRDTELRALIAQHQSGELSAEEVVQRLADRLAS
jgi:hypothetical protein